MIAGVILAGGLARRMGGGDKPLLTVAGRPLLGHVIARLAPQVDMLAINANGDPARFADFDLPVVPDTVADTPGPLAGVLAGMDWAAAQGAGAVVTVAGDTPFFPADLTARLSAVAAPLACAGSGGRAHPVIGYWPVTLADDLRAALSEGTRKVDIWTARHGIGIAEWPTDPHDPFFNVNRPDDRAEAERIAGA